MAIKIFTNPVLLTASMKRIKEFLILELLTVMLSKRRHHTSEPRFQAKMENLNEGHFDIIFALPE